MSAGTVRCNSVEDGTLSASVPAAAQLASWRAFQHVGWGVGGGGLEQEPLGISPVSRDWSG